MENITLKQMALRLGLSVASVSRALNDSHEISEKTKEAVRKLAKELNYQPNPFAASLRKSKSKTIVLIVPEISNNFFSQILNAVDHTAKENGYHVIIYSTNENHEQERSILQHFISGRVDGILLSSCVSTQDISHLQEIIKRKIPLVLFDRVAENTPFSSVQSNDYESAFAATQYLMQHKDEKIAFLKFGEQLSNIENRAQGYIDAINANKNYNFVPLVLETNDNETANFELIEKLIVREKPSIIFASVEHLAITVYDVCRKLKINIPSDVKVLAYSNLGIARHLNPSLSTITHPANLMGKNAVELLLAQINHKEKEIEKQSLVIDAELILRDSTSNGIKH